MAANDLNALAPGANRIQSSIVGFAVTKAPTVHCEAQLPWGLLTGNCVGGPYSSPSYKSLFYFWPLLGFLNS